MRHPVRDRFLILLCALAALCAAAYAVAVSMGKMTFEPFIMLMQQASFLGPKTKAILIAAAVVLALFALLLFGSLLPAKKKRSSTFAIQRNENGTVRISLKALETLVQKCLNQHAELKVVTSSLFSDEESVRVDIHINLQTDISMPLAISALQKQIKKYLEACSGVQVQEVRIFVEGMIPATEETANSPYALPASLLGGESSEALPAAEEAQAVEEETAKGEEPAKEETVEAPAEQEAVQSEENADAVAEPAAEQEKPQETEGE